MKGTATHDVVIKALSDHITNLVKEEVEHRLNGTKSEAVNPMPAPAGSQNLADIIAGLRSENLAQSEALQKAKADIQKLITELKHAKEHMQKTHNDYYGVLETNIKYTEELNKQRNDVDIVLGYLKGDIPEGRLELGLLKKIRSFDVPDTYTTAALSSDIDALNERVRSLTVENDDLRREVGELETNRYTLGGDAAIHVLKNQLENVIQELDKTREVLKNRMIEIQDLRKELERGRSALSSVRDITEGYHDGE